MVQEWLSHPCFVCLKPDVGFAWWSVLVDHSGHSPLTLTHLIHEHHDDIPWNSVPLRGLRGATFVAKYYAYDVLFIKCYIVVRLCMSCRCIMVVDRSRCGHRRIPRSIAVVFAPSVIVLSATDPPRPPSPRSSPTIGASGEPWTTTTTARPCRASRTSTASRRLFCARRPCSSPSSSLSFSSSHNALPKVGGGRPPRNCARTPPLPCRCCRHPPSQCRCRHCL